jgi:hypothetical protein
MHRLRGRGARDDVKRLTHEVDGYCSERLARATAAPSKSGGRGRPNEDAADAGDAPKPS